MLISETTEHSLRQAFATLFRQMAEDDLKDDSQLADYSLGSFDFDRTQIDTCIVQLRALGLIKESDRKRSVTNTQTYWALTPFGDRTMVQLRALRREPIAKRASGGKAEVVDADRNSRGLE